MNTMTGKLIAAGVLFVLTLISGVIVSRAGRPLNIVLFTIHKMISITTVFLLGYAAYQLYKAADTRLFVEVALMVITGILFLALIVTGAFLSREIQLPAAVLRIHQIIPGLSLIASALTLFLLVGNRI